MSKDPNWWPEVRGDVKVDGVGRFADLVAGIVVGVVAGYFLVRWIMIG